MNNKSLTNADKEFTHNESVEASLERKKQGYRVMSTYVLWKWKAPQSKVNSTSTGFAVTEWIIAVLWMI